MMETDLLKRIQRLEKQLAALGGSEVLTMTALTDLTDGGATTLHKHTGEVTNGNNHDHFGGDGAQINHKTLSNIGTTTHADIDTYIKDNGNITWLGTPLTSTSWDGDARSTTAATKIDMSSVFSGYPTDKVKAVMVRLACRDSAALGTTGLSIGVGPSATYYYNVSTVAIGGDVVSSQTAWCSCDANGDIYFRVVASGTKTLDAWLEVWAYIV